jgi:hypothetical protein
MQLWIKNWWNTHQSETLLTDIQEKMILEGVIELEEFSILEEMMKEKLRTHAHKPFIGIHTQENNIIVQNG